MLYSVQQHQHRHWYRSKNIRQVSCSSPATMLYSSISTGTGTDQNIYARSVVLHPLLCCTAALAQALVQIKKYTPGQLFFTRYYAVQQHQHRHWYGSNNIHQVNGFSPATMLYSSISTGTGTGQIIYTRSMVPHPLLCCTVQQHQHRHWYR
jgi:hypothetical protein